MLWLNLHSFVMINSMSFKFNVGLYNIILRKASNLRKKILSVGDVFYWANVAAILNIV